MARPLLLDLYCGAGGAAMGYHRAGFDVVGVDNAPQPNYPFEFHQGDALMFLRARGDEFDAIHASPPCQDHSTVTGRDRKRNGEKGTGWMLDATIHALRHRIAPWVVENVGTAQFPQNVYRVLLCGSSFGLNVRRHRWFATNVAMLNPPCDHAWQTPRFRSLDSRKVAAGTLASVVGVHGSTQYVGDFALRCDAMQIYWMTNAELSQAIPPAYTEYIGQHLIESLLTRESRGTT